MSHEHVFPSENHPCSICYPDWKAPDISVWPWEEGGWVINIDGQAVGEAFTIEDDAEKVAEWLRDSFLELWDIFV